MMLRFFSTIRDHRHFVIVVAVLTVVMTYPTIRYVFNTDVFWLPIDSGDIWIKIWDLWYGKLILSGQADYYLTDLSFYPDGMSLAYHIFTIPHMIILGVLQLFLPVSNAYNVAYLLIIISATSSAYIYLLYLIKDRWISLFGAICFGFCGYIVGRAPHPAENLLFSLPLALYFFHRFMLERRWLFVFISGFLVGFAAFTGMYMFVCLLMTLGAYIVSFAIRRWRDRGFWLQVALLCSIIGLIGTVRVYPMLSNSVALGSVLNKTGGEEQENDLLQFFINYENPIANRLITNRVTTAFVQFPDPGRWNSSYLGYTPLILIGFGIIGGNYRRRMLPWVILIFPFLLLRLGSVLTINGYLFENILLPKYYFARLMPVVFDAFYAPDHFQIGVLLPLAVLSCYGLMEVLRSVPSHRRSWIVLIAIALLSIEYFRSPPREKIVTKDEIAFLDWLAAEDDQDSIRLINLPHESWKFETLSLLPDIERLSAGGGTCHAHASAVIRLYYGQSHVEQLA